MRLHSVRVTHYRSVDDSEEFEIADVTCLVGKNAAGKSALLLAIAGLNPHDATPVEYNKERDYPRSSLHKYDTTHLGNDARVVCTQWKLDAREKTVLEESLGEGCLTTDLVEISRSYDQPVLVLPSINFENVFKHLFESYSLSEDEIELLEGAANSDALMKILGEFEGLSDNLILLKKYFRTNGNLRVQITEKVISWLPSILYVSAYDRMDGTVQIENALSLKKKGHIWRDEHVGKRLFMEFMEFAGVSINEISHVRTYETFNANLQAASNSITDKILDYWTLNPYLEVRVSIDKALSGDPAPFNTGTIARAKVYNSLHRADTPFSERSAGFGWFFSFFVKVSQAQSDGNPALILLDEPGITLHGKAQADLLRFFDEVLVGSGHQVIYSTHSPFMVPVNKLSSVRIVEDLLDDTGIRPKPTGTKVKDNVLSSDPNTLFPLQGALGYEITQSVFIGESLLLVEAPGDILYLQALSDALVKRKRVGLDKRWTLCPAGGIEKIEPFVSLFGGNRASNVAVLSSLAVADDNKIQCLKESEILKAGQFHTIAAFLERSEAGIEDIFEPELFVSILNSCYRLTATNELSTAKLQAANPDTERLVKQAEAAFENMPAELPQFAHFSPASWLISNNAVLEEESEMVSKTLDRAEKIFSTFNELL